MQLSKSIMEIAARLCRYFHEKKARQSCAFFSWVLIQHNTPPISLELGLTQPERIY